MRDDIFLGHDIIAILDALWDMGEPQTSYAEEILSPNYFDLQRDFLIFTFRLPGEQLYFGVLSREVCLVLVKLLCMSTTLTDDSVSLSDR